MSSSITTITSQIIIANVNYWSVLTRVKDRKVEEEHYTKAVVG
jgi:hypothetical protein